MKVEKIRELQRNVMREIQGKGAMPKEINNLLEIGFDGILQIYKNYSCDSETIEKYINGKKEEVRSILNNFGENRKAEQMQFVNIFFSRLLKQIEEGQIKENKTRNMGDISKMKFQNKGITNRIFAQIESSFQNIRAAQRKLLSSRGYSQEQIQSIDVDVQAFIKSFRKNDERIKRDFELDEKEFQQLIKEKYEEYMQYEEKEEKKLAETEKSKNKKDGFKKGLDAKIPLKTQRDNAQKFVREQKSKENEQIENVLRDDVIY